MNAVHENATFPALAQFRHFVFVGALLLAGACVSPLRSQDSREADSSNKQNKQNEQNKPPKIPAKINPPKDDLPADKLSKEELPTKPAVPSKNYAAEYRHQFNGDPASKTGYEWIGPNAENCVVFEPGGLRITLPSGFGGPRPTTGVNAPYRLQGDFEITIDYEILQEPTREDTGNGTRFSLGILEEGAREGVATISRSLGAKSGQVHVAWTSRKPAEAGKAEIHSHVFPTTHTRGKLRLVRQGSELYFVAANQDDTQLPLLVKLPFGDADIYQIRLAGATGGKQSALDVRVENLTIRADAISGVPQQQAAQNGSAPATPANAGGRRLEVAGIVASALIAVAIGVWLFLRGRRRSAEETTENSDEEESSGEVGDAEKAGGTPQRSTVSVKCPGCGRPLRAKRTLAGKTLKCPRCGSGVPV